MALKIIEMQKTSFNTGFLTIFGSQITENLQTKVVPNFILQTRKIMEDHHLDETNKQQREEIWHSDEGHPPAPADAPVPILQDGDRLPARPLPYRAVPTGHGCCHRLHLSLSVSLLVTRWP